MNRTQGCLEIEQVRNLMEGGLAPADLAAAEEHLSTCDQCRTRVDQAIAKTEWWQEARESLSGNDSNDQSSDDEISTQSDVLALLGPTDDPHKMGRIGNYEIVGILGRGGMGVVFKGFDPPLNRFVAIKMLLPHLATCGAARKRFAREAQAAAAVVDDHVMAIHCVSEWQGKPYLVMPYNKGVSLHQRLAEEGPLELREILRIGMQAAKGLAAAHAQGLVHRDVKPANILLADGVERVSLTDFGLARAVDDASVTRTGVLAGTPQYMSPEQARAQPVNFRSDLFSLGSVLYAMCTGRPPFRAETSYSILRLIIDEEPTPIREINSDIPDWLCRLIGKLMAKQPEDRFASAHDVADLLEQCLAHVQEPTSTPLPPGLILAQPRRALSVPSRIGMIIMSLFACCVLLFGINAVTSPPDIAGKWASDEWGQIDMSETAPGEYSGSYTNSNSEQPGTLSLTWSRLQGRFNGTWKTGANRFGEISLRVLPGEIRGARRIDTSVNLDPEVPRLTDLTWKRPSDMSVAKRLNNAVGVDPNLVEPAALPSQKSKKELPGYAQLQGTWQMTSSIDPQGTIADKGHVEAVSYVIRDDILEFRNSANSNASPKTRFTLDVTQSPIRFEFIDYVTKDADGTIHRMVGLLEVNDEKLRICWGPKLPEKIGTARGVTYSELRRNPPLKKPAAVKDPNAVGEQTPESTTKGDK